MIIEPAARPSDANYAGSRGRFGGDTLMRRLLIVYGAAVAAMILVAGVVVAVAVWPHFVGLEEREAEHRQNAALQAVQSEQDRLRDLANTYGAWDAPFDYLLGSNPRFPETDLNPAALAQIEVDAAIIVDNAGDVIFEGLRRDIADAALLPAVERAVLTAPGLRLTPDEASKAAVISMSGRAVMVSVRRVVRTDGAGDSPGVIALARIVSEGVMARMTHLTGVDFRLVAADTGRWRKQDGVRTHALIPDAWGDPALRLLVVGAPEVLNLGVSTISKLALIMLAIVAALAAAFAFALAAAVVDPVRALERNVGAMSRGAPPSESKRRPPAEIRSLAAAFAEAFERSRREAALHKAAHDEAIAARAAAERANRAKSRFIATMSHELRTPLNAVIGYSEMMQEAAAEAGRFDDSADFDRILAAARGLLNLINSILDFARLENGRMPVYPERFVVADLAASVADIVRPTIAAKGLKLNLIVAENTGVAYSDATRLSQCLVNLLSNAVKFTAAGDITFRVGRRRDEKGDWLLFAVEDTGIGMTPEQTKRIFEPFEQADDSIGRRYGGAGLGLTITREILAHLGGRIGVKSELGLGTRFVLKTPARHVEVTDHASGTERSAA